MERMKKFLSGLSKTRHGMLSLPTSILTIEVVLFLFLFFQSVLAHEPLRVSLEDLHLAESKGKWWLVGSAWGGDPLVDKRAKFTKSTGVSADQEATADEDPNDLLKLARSQGMNTDIRRGVFLVLMSSDVRFFLRSTWTIRLRL